MKPTQSRRHEVDKLAKRMAEIGRLEALKSCHRSGKLYDKPIDWEEMPQEIKHGWLAVARYIHAHYTRKPGRQRR